MSQRCAYCGERIDSEKWHPVATVRDAEGTAEILDFCCEGCRDAWEADDSMASD